MSDSDERFNPPRPQVAGSSPYSSASEAILKALRPRRGQETGKWLAALGQDSVAFSSDAQPQVSAPVQAPLKPEQRAVLMKSWIDKMFDDFERYCFEFNQTAAGTDLIMQCQRPQFGGEETQQMSSSAQALKFEGHLTTRFWTMLLLCQPDKIDVVVIPAEMRLGYSMNPSVRQEYPSFMEIFPCWGEGDLKWKVGDEIISGEMLSPLARELFGDLVRVASGTMSESELFSAHSLKLKQTEDRSSSSGQPHFALSGAPSLALASLSLWAAARALNKAVEADIDNLAQEASKAFQADDMSLSERHNRLIKRLKDFRDNLSTLIGELSVER